MTAQLILASQSKQRQALLKTLGLEFTVIPAEIDEQAVAKGSGLAFRAKKIARAKAQAIAKVYPKAVVIAADTYAVLKNQPLEKPLNQREAISMLHQQAGQTIEAHTGFAYWDQDKEIDYATQVVTRAIFRDLSDQEIEHYVKTEPVLTWSAAFCPAYSAGAALIAEVQGSLTAFTHGLPMEELVPLLKKSGILVDKNTYENT